FLARETSDRSNRWPAAEIEGGPCTLYLLWFIFKVLWANAIINHFDAFGRDPGHFEQTRSCLRDRDSTRSSRMAEEDITRTDDDGVGRMHNRRNTNFLGCQAGMQMSRVQVTMHHFRSLLPEHHCQCPHCFWIERVLIAWPGIDHLDALHGHAQFRKVLCQRAGARADNFDLSARPDKPLHQVQQVTL